MSQYVVMSIGCLCCNEPSILMTVVDDLDAARVLGAKPVEEADWGYGVGLVAFELPPSQSPPIESGHP
jgi:hypothetical protein